MDIPSILRQEITNFLISLPNIHDSNSQKALIFQAAFDLELQDQITFGTPPAQFVPLLMSILLKYGKLNDGRYALEAILEAAKNYIGQDRKVFCDELIQKLYTELLEKKEQRLQIKIDALNRQRETLDDKLYTIEQSQATATNISQQIKLNSHITEVKYEREKIEQQIEKIEEQLEQYPENGYKLLFINADTTDLDLCNNICQTLQKERIIEFVKFNTDRRKPAEIRDAFEAWILDCDALVIIYGNADFGWLNQTFKNIRKVVWRRINHPLPTYILCDPSPEQKQLIQFSFRGIQSLKYASYLDEYEFRNFISSL